MLEGTYFVIDDGAAAEDGTLTDEIGPLWLEHILFQEL